MKRICRWGRAVVALAVIVLSLVLWGILLLILAAIWHLL